MRPGEWAGAVGDVWAAEWRRTDRSFAGLDAALLAAVRAVAPAGAALVVDVGCGAGATSLAVAGALPDAAVVGLDLSAALVAVADERRAAAGLDPARCRFAVGDAAAGAGALGPVDLFVSRHGVMFFPDPVAAFAALRAAAAPGAALVFSCFAELAANPWATEPVAAPAPDPLAPGPFAFADPARVGAILAAAGWAAEPPARAPFRYVAGAGPDPVGDAAGFFARVGPAARALRDADPAGRPALHRRLVAACERRCDGGAVTFPAAAWLWTAREESRR